MHPIKPQFLVLALSAWLGVTAVWASDQAVTEEIYVSAIIKVLPPGEAREALKSYPQSKGFDPQGYLSFGRSICEQLKRGTTESQLIEGNLDAFVGPELAKAMVQAAKEVICPNQ